jgi:GNAT superfamily N-acetyltransferase
MPAEVMLLAPDHAAWHAYLAHVERVGHRRWLPVDGADLPLPASEHLAVLLDDDVVGHLSLLVQPLIVPATAWSGGVETPLRGPDGVPLAEAFVQTFAVDEAHQRRGLGSALQRAALARAATLGCHQLRSWSSLDARANHALKLRLGFGAHPAVYVASDGTPISGVYFVRAVTPAW